MVISRGTQRRFPPKCFENTFQAIQIQKCILSGAKKFIPVRSSQGNLSLFEITRASVLFSRKFQLQFYEGDSFSDSSAHRIFDSENVRFPFSTKNSLTLQSEMGKIELQKIVGNLLDKRRKLSRNGTVIQKFIAFLKLQKILGKFCFSEQILRKKQPFGAPVSSLLDLFVIHVSLDFTAHNI